MPITINGEMCTADFDVFTVFLPIVSEELNKYAREDGFDILFTDSDGTTKLPHIIADWDKYEGRLVAHVDVPNLMRGEDRLLYMYYGNPNSINQQDPDNCFKMARGAKLFSKDPLRPRSESNLHLDANDRPTVQNTIEWQLEVYRQLLPNGWFEQDTSGSTHPAALRFAFLKQLLEDKGRFTIDNLHELVKRVMYAQLETTTIANCTFSSIVNYSIGCLTNYGDTAVLSRIRNEAIDPDKYFDILTEFNFASFCIEHGYEVIARQVQGCDFQINIENWPLPVLAECKRLRNGTLSTRVGRIIAKANNQIKIVETEAYGIVVIDVSAFVTFRPDATDDIPVELQDFIKEAELSLRTFNSSVSAAIILWNEISVKGDPRVDYIVMPALRTRSLTIQHKQPKFPLPDANALVVGRTILASMHINANQKTDQYVKPRNT